MNDEYVLTTEALRAQRMVIVFAHEEAKSELARLIFELKTIGKRGQKVTALVDAVEINPEYPEQSEVALLLLTLGDFEGFDQPTMRALANSIAGARKKVKDADEMRRSLGV